MSLPPIFGIPVPDIPGLGALAAFAATAACVGANYVLLPVVLGQRMDDAAILSMIALWLLYFATYTVVYAWLRHTRRFAVELMHILLSIVLASMLFNYCADLLGFIFAMLFLFFPAGALAAVVASAVLYGVILAVFYLGSYYVIELARDRCILVFGGSIE
jgi:hypothetical protein